MSVLDKVSIVRTVLSILLKCLDVVLDNFDKVEDVVA